MKYDTIIIGAGAAGCSAAIYATRYNLKTLLIGGPMPGGLISEALEVENYPGYLSINGMELSQKFIKHATTLGADYNVETVQDIRIIDGDEKGFEVTTGENTYIGKSIILSMGTEHRKLSIPGELEFAGKGVSYCSTCDGPFFKEKTVAVVGGGNSAVEGAHELTAFAKTVYLIYRSELKAAPLYVTNMRKRDNILEVAHNNIVEIVGDTLVNKIKLESKYKGSDELSVDGVFVQIGYKPRNEIAKKLNIELDENGFVKVDNGMGTNLKGIFSAGDLNNGSNQLHQQVTSASEGAIAAQSAYRYINGLEYLIK